jgi:hypothetical protein
MLANCERAVFCLEQFLNLDALLHMTILEWKWCLEYEAVASGASGAVTTRKN